MVEGYGEAHGAAQAAVQFHAWLDRHDPRNLLNRRHLRVVRSQRGVAHQDLFNPLCIVSSEAETRFLEGFRRGGHSQARIWWL